MPTSGLTSTFIYLLTCEHLQHNTHMYTQEVRCDYEITWILTIAKCLLR